MANPERPIWLTSASSTISAFRRAACGARPRRTLPPSRLYSNRIQATQARLNEAAKLYIAAVRRNQHELFDPQALGFEFTMEQIEVRAIDLQPDLFDDYWAAEPDGAH
jgi:hypothetical protein